MIQTVVYKTNPLYTNEDYVFIRLDVSSATTRTKSSKMILDLEDIQKLIMPSYNSENCLEK
jgi:hypothetical protein